MAYFNGTFSTGTTGSVTIPVGFQPVWISIRVGSTYSATDSYGHLSIGSGKPSLYHVDSIFSDTTGSKTYSSESNIIYSMKRVSGNVTAYIAASLTAFTTNGFTLNFTAADAGPNIYVEAWN